MLVARGRRGLCAVVLGDSRQMCIDELRRRFGDAQLIDDPPAVADLAGAVAGLLRDPHRKAEIPLELCGTAFQISVWRALDQIPAGSTRSYSQIARSIGQPGATRAVAAACAANPLAVVIPCHRVIGADGSLSGYRWGVERKVKLLAMEGVYSGMANAFSDRGGKSAAKIPAA